MKRFVSVLLVLATLLCLVPVSATAATEEPQANSEESTFSYLDLYVKDGLVALFDAYSATASDEALTSWTPVDFYGKEGYEDYLALADYPLYDNTSHYAWKWTNGALASVRQSASGDANSTTSNAFYFDLNAIGAVLGTTYTVQTVTQITDMRQNRPHPTVEVNADGKYVITNYSSFSGKGTETTYTYFGPLRASILGYNKYSGSNDPVISAHFIQVSCLKNATATSNSATNIFFNKGQYFTDATARTYYYMNGETLTSIGKAVLGNFPWGIMEQTVSRLGDGTPFDDGSGTKVPYRLTWHFTPSKYGSSGASSNSLSTNVKITTDSTTLRPVSCNIQNVFSIRIYNIDLDQDARNRNHFADLLGYYGTNTDPLSAFSEKHFAIIAPKFATIQMYKDKYESDGTTLTEDFLAAKEEFENTLDAANKEAEETFVKPTDYDLLYVKDGLVALFTAYKSKATDANPTAWTPVDFYGAKGYDDYLDHATYSYALTGSWNWTNGALVSNGAGTLFDLSGLGALLGTTWSVQTVYQMNSVKNTDVSSQAQIKQETVDNGDGTTTIKNVISNYTSLTYWGDSKGFEYGNSAYGPLTLSLITAPSYYSTNDKVLNSYFLQLSHRNAGNTGNSATNVMFCNANYGMTHGKWYYTNAEGVEGSVSAWTSPWPTVVFDQTVSRLGDAVQGDATVSVPYRLTWQFAPSNRTGGTRSYAHTAYSAADSTALKVLAGLCANNYAVRVYNKVLSIEEIDRNHLIDLCAFYGTDVSLLETMTEHQLVLVGSKVAHVPLYRDRTDAQGMAIAKRDFESALHAAVAFAISEGADYTYQNLYVKDGLVALFTAYESKATDANPTAWTPVNFYGAKGYDDYLDPATYSHALTGTWNAGNGSFISTGSGTSFDLSALGAMIGTTWSVQTVWNLISVNNTSDSTLAKIEQVTVDNGDGTFTTKNVITNRTSLSKWNTAGGFEGGKSTYGPLTMNLYTVPSYYANVNNIPHLGGAYFVQVNTSSSVRNIVFCSEDYGMKKDTFYFTNADGTESSVSAWAAEFPAPVMEQTVARLGDGVVGDTTTTFSWRITYQFAPTGFGANSVSRSFTHSLAKASDSTTLTVLVGKKANNYSVRVYKKDLSIAEIDQNHLADLCGFFGVDASPLSFVMEDKLAALVAEYATVKMLSSKTDENGNYTDEYITVKNKLQLAINALAQEELTSIENAQNTLMSFDGYSFRISGDYGIRALFSLNKLSEERLSKKQVEVVAFGAITAIGEYDGNPYNTLENLVLTVADDGTLSLPVAGAAFIASTDASFKTLSESDTAVRFAYTATYPVDSNGAVFAIDMLYRGYAVLQDADGAYSVSYYDIPEEQVLSSLYDLHAEIVDDYGIYKDTLGTGAAFDRLYDVLTTVDPNKHDKDAREAARELADNYGFDEAAITHRFFTMSDVHCTTPRNSQKLTNILTRVNELYGGKVDAFLFAGDVADKINGGASGYDAAAFATGYKQLALFAEYTAAGNINNVPIVWTLGNHERPTTATPGDVTITTDKNKVAYTIPANSSMLDAAYQIFGGTSSAFASATAGAPKGIRYNEIDGVSYFAVDYAYITADMLLWFDAELTRIENEKPGLPIIVTSHMPTYLDECPAAFVNLLSTHSNVLYLSGHVHTPMQNYSTVAERDGFQEIVVGPGNHASYGVSGGGYSYNSYEMRQGVVIEIDDRGNVRATMLDFAFNVEPDGSITELIHKGTQSGNTDNTAAENPLVLRQVLYTRPSRKHALKRVYDTVVYSKDLPEYEAPKFGEDAKLSVSDSTEASLVLGIDKATATNLIKRYKITLTDSEGNAVRIYDPLGKKNVTALEIGSDYIVYGLYDNYPDTYVYKLYGGRTTTTVTVTEDDPATEDVDETVTETVTTYDLIVGESYTVTVVAYDDFGMETNAISTTFTIPNP